MQLLWSIHPQPRPERISTDKVPRSIYSELKIIKHSRRYVTMSKRQQKQQKSETHKDFRVQNVYLIHLMR